jgi:hypothetical protein
MLSSQEIDRHIADIRSGLQQIAETADSLPLCCRIHQHLEALRQQYREYPTTLTARVQELALLHAQFEVHLAARMTVIVDHLHEINQAIRTAEDERQFWRDVLVQHARTSGCLQIEGAAAVVRVRALQARLMPPAHSNERTRLEELIRSAGVWDRVSQLSRPKLEKSLNERAFDAQTAEAIGQLCPPTVTYQVTSRALAAQPAKTS